MEQMELPMDGMLKASDMQDALGHVVLCALDGAFVQGMPAALESISIEGLDGSGTVTVNAVTADGQKFSAEVEIMEMEEDDAAEGAEGADAPAPPPDGAPPAMNAEAP